MAATGTDTITQIDGHYHHAGRAAAYLIQDGDEAAFVDNVTRFSVPYLMKALENRGLKPEQVRYLIVTHIHLDHSGGTAELAKQCPAATVICHPRAARHIVDPERLVASARPVYGDEAFDRLYGEIEPVDEARVRSMEDSETLELGSRTLTFLDSPGHARHHFAIQDSGTNSMFSGDAYGLCYPQLQGGTRPHVSYVAAPPQFDPTAAMATVERIRGTGVDRAFVTHFGCCEAMAECGDQLLEDLEAFKVLADTASGTDLEGEKLLSYCSEGALEVMRGALRRSGLDPEDDEVFRWATSEHSITSQGLQVLAEQLRESA